jgi:hypothetical protein
MMCGGNAPAETNPYWARSWLVMCVTAAHVLGSGLRKTPKRNWLSTSVRPSLIPQGAVDQPLTRLGPTVTKPGTRQQRTRRCSRVADQRNALRDSEEASHLPINPSPGSDHGLDAGGRCDAGERH